MKAIFDNSKYYIVQSSDTYSIPFVTDENLSNYNIIGNVYDISNQSSVPSNYFSINISNISDNNYIAEMVFSGIVSDINKNYYLQLWATTETLTLPIGKLDIEVVVDNQNPETETLRLPNNGGTFTYYTVLPNTNFNAKNWNVEVITMQDNVVVSNINSAPTFISFVVNAGVNYSYTNDECIIRITKTIEDELAVEQEQTFDFVFYQDVSTNWIRCNPSAVSFTDNGGTIQLEATANFNVQKWDISFVGDGNTWATTRMLSATNSTAIAEVIAVKNITTNVRSGKIIINADGYTLEVQAKQNGIQIAEGYFNVNNQVVDYVESVNTLYYSTYNIDTSTIEVTTNVEWITLSDITPNNLTYTVEQNNNLEDRTAIISFSATDLNGDRIQDECIIEQLAFNVYPICEDIFHEVITNKNNVEYQIKLDNKIVYQGRAYKKPNENKIRFNINKLVYMYLNSNLPNFFKVVNNNFLTEISEYYKKFDVFVDGNFSRSYYFINDYSYNFERLVERSQPNNTVILSDPINKKIDKRQVFLYSLFTPVKTDLPTNIIYRDEYHVIQQTRTTTTQQWLILDDKLSEHPNATMLSVNGDTYDLIDSCSRYCIYYVNSIGGWDSFLIDGNDKKIDNITRYSTIKNFDNTKTDFEKKNYVSIINPKITLYTGWLNDDEASRMFNLLESNELYLHDLIDGSIVPINILNSTCEYKTFTNSGKHKFNYTIEVEVAQSKIRR